MLVVPKMTWNSVRALKNSRVFELDKQVSTQNLSTPKLTRENESRHYMEKCWCVVQGCTLSCMLQTYHIVTHPSQIGHRSFHDLAGSPRLCLFNWVAGRLQTAALITGVNRHLTGVSLQFCSFFFQLISEQWCQPCSVHITIVLIGKAPTLGVRSSFKTKPKTNDTLNIQRGGLLEERMEGVIYINN